MRLAPAVGMTLPGGLRITNGSEAPVQNAWSSGAPPRDEEAAEKKGILRNTLKEMGWWLATTGKGVQFCPPDRVHDRIVEWQKSKVDRIVKEEEAR